jgi:hypothetical protein
MTSVVKRLVPLRRSKGPGKLSLPAFPTPRHHASNTNKGYMSYIPNWPPNGCRGVLTAQGSKAKPVDGSEPPRTTRARDEATQKVSSSWCIWCPIEGIQHPQSSYLSPEWEVSIMPSMWASIEPSRFSMRIILERRVKPPDQDLIGGH